MGIAVLGGHGNDGACPIVLPDRHYVKVAFVVFFRGEMLKDDPGLVCRAVIYGDAISTTFVVAPREEDLRTIGTPRGAAHAGKDECHPTYESDHQKNHVKPSRRLRPEAFSLGSRIGERAVALCDHVLIPLCAHRRRNGPELRYPDEARRLTACRR